GRLVRPCEPRATPTGGRAARGTQQINGGGPLDPAVRISCPLIQREVFRSGAVNDRDKTEDQLLDELQDLRARLARLEHTANGHACAMTALREEKQQFTHALETIADGVVLYGMDGRTFFANPAAQAILGVPRGELVGR